MEGGPASAAALRTEAAIVRAPWEGGEGGAPNRRARGQIRFLQFLVSVVRPKKVWGCETVKHRNASHMNSGMAKSGPTGGGSTTAGE